jgi:mannose-6-phosphate isomerase-like protein (cupin superfamily)
MRTRYAEIPAYVTKDGSEIRELLHPLMPHGPRNQSLAEAVIKPGQRTELHCHRRTEEIYHLTAGKGRMTLGEAQFEVQIGDSVLIPPGTAHCIEAIGIEDLHLLCCCSPPYDHSDTELL